MSLKQLAGQTAIYGLSSILSRILNYVVMTFYLTGVFPREEYGVVSEMYAYVALLMVFFTFRMETAFFRFGSKPGYLDQAFSTASIMLSFTTLFFTGLLVWGAPTLGRLLDTTNYENYILWFAFVIAMDTLAAIPFAQLRLTNRPIKFAALKTINILVNIASIFFFLGILPDLDGNQWTSVFSYDETDRIKYVFIANFLGSAATFLLLIPEYFKVKLKFDIALFKLMLSYSWPLVIVGFAAVVNQQLNIPLVKFLSTDNEEIAKVVVGEYSACFKIAMLMSLAIQAFNYAAEPFFFRNMDREDARSVYAQVGQAFALTGSFIFLGIALYLDIFKYLIRDPDYWIALGVVPILSLAFFFLGLYYNFSIWFKLRDKTIFGAYISVGGSILTLVLNFALIPKIGYYGAAYSALACYMFMTAASYLTGQRYYPIPYPIGKMILYIVLAVGVYLISDQLFIHFDYTTTIKLLVNTGLFLTYVSLIAIVEKEVISRYRTKPAP